MKYEMDKKGVIYSIVVTILVGGIFAMFPAKVVDLISYIIGGMLILGGIYNVAMYFRYHKTGNYSLKLSIGLIFIILGVYMLIRTDFIFSILAVFFGFYIIINGMFALQVAIEGFRVKHKNWILTFLIAMVNLAFGIVVLLEPFGTTIVFIKFIGIFMVLGSVLNLIALAIGNKNE